MTLLEALIQIRDAGPPNKRGGICTNLYNILGNDTHEIDLHKLFKSYPGFTGDDSFPLTSETAYTDGRSRGVLWEGGALKIRMDFINFAIKELRNEEI